MQRQGGIEGGAAPVEQVVGAGPANPQQPGMMAQQPGLVSQAGPQQGIPTQPGIAGKPAGLPVQGAGMMTRCDDGLKTWQNLKRRDEIVYQL